MAETITLPNGLRIVTEEMPHTHSVSMGFFTKVGSLYEDARINGISHFLEHMFFKGTEKRPTAKEISEAIEGVGGYLNASTSLDVTVYFCKVANIHFERGVDVLTDMLCHATIDANEVEKERRVIIEEINMSLDQPADWVHQVLDEVMWGDQPLGRDIAGSIETVSGITREDLQEYRQRHYNFSNMVVSIAGSLTKDQMINAVTTALSTLGKGEVSQPLPAQPSQPGPAVRLITKPTEQINFCLGLPALSFNAPTADRRALQVVDAILGGGMSSRLFQEIRENRGLAYSVGSYTREDSDAGKWVIYGSVEVSKAQDAVAAVIEELRKLRDEGVTDAELTRIKEQVKGGMLLGLEDTWAVARRNGVHTLRYGQIVPVEQVVAEIEAVTHEDISRVMNELVRGDRLHLAVIGPHEDQAAYEKLLAL